ncbi:uncharacterized protein [Nicotiana tomentosiformis]|uniref:uncharacterized protein n=1 Tax=Nicotiana tomentosiformis TaxID=4098 RepID=UPI00388C4338
MQKTFCVVRVFETEVVELASYNLKEVEYSWFESWEESREEGSPLTKWNEFLDAFMDHLLPAETKLARAAEFKNLKQGSMSVWDYNLKFEHLSRYAIYILPTMEARVRRFVQGLSPLVINEAATTTLNSDMNYGKMVGFSQATETRNLRNRMERDGSKKAWCGLKGYIQRDCLSSRESAGRGKVQSASSVAITSAAPPPA